MGARRKYKNMKKCILWGMGEGYEGIHHSVRLEILKKNISIIAIVSKDIITDNYDGYKVIKKRRIKRVSI